MVHDDPDQHLSQMSTAWTLLFQAHVGPSEELKAARRLLIQQYSGPVYRYLRASLGDPDAADEVYQEFALRLVRGDFQRAQPDRGRFRDFLKTTLYHLIVDYHRREKRRPLPLPDEANGLVVESSLALASDEDFLATWRAELLDKAWKALSRWEEESGQPLCTILHFRTNHPEMQSPQMAEQLSVRLGRAVSPVWVRKRLHVARERFADYLIEEVARTLDPPGQEALEQELLDIGLLDYCRSALKKRRAHDT